MANLENCQLYREPSDLSNNRDPNATTKIGKDSMQRYLNKMNKLGCAQISDAQSELDSYNP